MKKKYTKFINKIFIIIFVLLLCIYLSCPQPRQLDEEEDYFDFPDIITKKWETGDDGYIQFKTNDKDLLTETPEGISYWHPISFQDNPSDEFIVDVNKLSGQDSFGYGVIFCIQDEPGIDKFTTSNFYALLITVKGLFQIIKVVEKYPYTLMIPGSDINGWVIAENENNETFLEKGENVLNRIKIVTSDLDNDDNPEFTIYFNDNLVYEFEENFTVSADGNFTFDLYKYSKGKDKYGFIVTMSPREYFPYVPVNVKFNLINPQAPILSSSIQKVQTLSVYNNIDCFFQNSRINE